MKTKNDPHLLTRRTIDVINKASMRLLILVDELPPFLEEEIQILSLIEHNLTDEYLTLLKGLLVANSSLVTAQERNDYGPTFKSTI